MEISYGSVSARCLERLQESEDLCSFISSIMLPGNKIVITGDMVNSVRAFVYEMSTDYNFSTPVYFEGRKRNFPTLIKVIQENKFSTLVIPTVYKSYRNLVDNAVKRLGTMQFQEFELSRVTLNRVTYYLEVLVDKDDIMSVKCVSVFFGNTSTPTEWELFSFTESGTV